MRKCTGHNNDKLNIIREYYEQFYSIKLEKIYIYNS